MIAKSAVSSAPVDRLWDVVAALEAWPQHLPTFTSVVLSPDSPVASGLGARFDVRQPGLQRATYEVTTWRPRESFTWIARSRGIVTTGVHSVTAHGGGSKIELSLQWRGPLAPLVRVALGRRVGAMVEQEASTFAGLAEVHG